MIHEWNKMSARRSRKPPEIVVNENTLLPSLECKMEDFVEKVNYMSMDIAKLLHDKMRWTAFYQQYKYYKRKIKKKILKSKN